MSARVSTHSSNLRTIKQPGPSATERIVAVEARGQTITFDLEPGMLLVDGIRRGFAALGFMSGVVEFGALALGPFAYVMPALSKTGENAAFYSDIYRPQGISRLQHGSMTFGRRDGTPFFHCHALWTEADGRVTGGHILPDISRSRRSGLTARCLKATSIRRRISNCLARSWSRR
jgi:hypothetical protein